MTDRVTINVEADDLWEYFLSNVVEMETMNQKHKVASNDFDGVEILLDQFCGCPVIEVVDNGSTIYEKMCLDEKELIIEAKDAYAIYIGEIDFGEPDFIEGEILPEESEEFQVYEDRFAAAEDLIVTIMGKSFAEVRQIVPDVQIQECLDAVISKLKEGGYYEDEE